MWLTLLTDKNVTIKISCHLKSFKLQKRHFECFSIAVAILYEIIEGLEGEEQLP